MISKNFYLKKLLLKRSAAFDYETVLYPFHAKAFNNRELIYEDQRNFNQALRVYSKAIELDPNYANAYKNRSDIYEKLRDWDKSAADLKKFKPLNK